MERLIFDTDILIDSLRGYSPARQALKLSDGYSAISSLSIAEIYQGIRKGTEEQIVESLLAELDILPVDAAIAEQAGWYLHQYKKANNIGFVDAIIAATAVQHGLRLASLNKKHYPMLNNVLVPYGKH